MQAQFGEAHRIQLASETSKKNMFSGKTEISTKVNNQKKKKNKKSGSATGYSFGMHKFFKR